MTTQKEKRFFTRSKTAVKVMSPKPLELPSFTRFITEKLHVLRLTQSFIYSSALSCVLLVAIGIVVFDLQKNRDMLLTIQQERANLLEKRTQWEKIVHKYKKYRDGYYQLAIIDYQLGNTEEMKDDVKKVLTIDPQFEQGKSLLQRIEE